MRLSQRKHDILCSAIDDYIKDACPITSGNVKEKQIIRLSTATLRHELSSLEEMGYLKQVHTSGGRVPTPEGYRYYVNYLMQTISVDKKGLQEVREKLSARTNSLSQVVAEIAKIISRATNYPTAILVNGYDKLIVEGINVVPLIEKEALVLIQTNSGYLNNTIKDVDNKKTCEDASKYLTKLFTGKTIGFLVENIDLIKEGIQKQIQNFSSIVDSIIDNLKKMAKKPPFDVRHEFSSNLALTSNAQDMQKMLALLSNEQKLASTLESCEQGELFVEIDKDDKNLAGLAVVRAPLVVDGQKVASIGVFGPQRMNYTAITSALKLVVEELKGGENGKKQK